MVTSSSGTEEHSEYGGSHPRPDFGPHSLEKLVAEPGEPDDVRRGEVLTVESIEAGAAGVCECKDPENVSINRWGDDREASRLPGDSHWDPESDRPPWLVGALASEPPTTIAE